MPSIAFIAGNARNKTAKGLISFLTLCPALVPSRDWKKNQTPYGLVLRVLSANYNVDAANYNVDPKLVFTSHHEKAWKHRTKRIFSPPRPALFPLKRRLSQICDFWCPQNIGWNETVLWTGNSSICNNEIRIPIVTHNADIQQDKADKLTQNWNYLQKLRQYDAAPRPSIPADLNSLFPMTVPLHFVREREGAAHLNVSDATVHRSRIDHVCQVWQLTRKGNDQKMKYIFKCVYISRKLSVLSRFLF